MRALIINRLKVLVVAAAVLVAASCAGPERTDGGTSDGAVALPTSVPEVPTPAAVPPTPAASPKPVPEATSSPDPTQDPAPTSTSIPAASAEDPEAAGERPGAFRVIEALPVEGVVDVRAVDFANGFPWRSADFGPIDVMDGAGSFGEFGDPAHVNLWIGEVRYGDLDGDGVDEAAVEVAWNTGGSGIFSHVRVFAVADAVLQEIGATGVGDRAHGGVHAFRFAGEELHVTTLLAVDQPGACCPDAVATSRWVVLGDQLAQAEVTAPQRYVRIEEQVNGEELEVAFLPGTSSAWLRLAGAGSQSLVFEAGAGQLVVVGGDSVPPSFAAELERLDTGELLPAPPGSGLPTVLPVSGFYRLHLTARSEAELPLEIALSITEPDAPSLPTWEFERLVVEGPSPMDRISALWPQLRGDEYAAVNEAVTAHIMGRVEERRTELNDPDRLPDRWSDLDLRYEVVGVAPDLISIRIDHYEYLCCRPYPNLGSRTLVADLAAGRVLDPDDYLDTGRLDELTGLVTRGLEESCDALTWSIELYPSAWDAVGLRADGLEVAFDRGELFGAAQLPLFVVLPWEDVTGLVDADLARRAAAGRTLSTAPQACERFE